MSGNILRISSRSRRHDRFLECRRLQHRRAAKPKRRDEMKVYMVRFAHLLNVSEALSRAMIVFALCHEVSHHKLDHLRSTVSRKQEFEADELGLRYFLRVVDAGEAARESSVYIDPKVAGAPLILSHLFGLFEVWFQTTHGDTVTEAASHPSAEDRLARITPILVPNLSDTALEVVRGFSAGISDFREALTKR